MQALPPASALWHPLALARSELTPRSTRSSPLWASRLERKILVGRPRAMHLHAQLEGQDHAREFLHA